MEERQKLISLMPWGKRADTKNTSWPTPSKVRNANGMMVGLCKRLPWGEGARISVLVARNNFKLPHVAKEHKSPEL